MCTTFSRAITFTRNDIIMTLADEAGLGDREKKAKSDSARVIALGRLTLQNHLEQEMNTLNTAQRQELLDQLRTMAFLQNLLWQAAMTVSDELLDCELDAVLEQVPNLAVVASGSDEDLAYDLDAFVEHCRRIVAAQHHNRPTPVQEV